MNRTRRYRRQQRPESKDRQNQRCPTLWVYRALSLLEFETLSLSLSLFLSPQNRFSSSETALFSLWRSLSDRFGMSTGELLNIEPQELQFPCKLSQRPKFDFSFALQSETKMFVFRLSDPCFCFQLFFFVNSNCFCL